MNRVTSMINRKVLSVGAVLVMLTAFGTGIYFLEERFARAEDLKQSNQNLKQHILDQKQVNLEGLKIRLERDIHQLERNIKQEGSDSAVDSQYKLNLKQQLDRINRELTK